MGLYSPERFLGRDFRESSNGAACMEIFLLKSIFCGGGVFFCDEFYFLRSGGGYQKSRL